MNAHLWITGTLLIPLAGLAWPAWLTFLFWHRPQLLDGVETMFDKIEVYTLVSVGAERCTTTLITATWDQVAAQAVKRSTEIGSVYVCVLHGVREWYWQYGRMTNVVIGEHKDDRRPSDTP
ncbi:hypothetical protein [Streptosporangium sp. OZ121]|uniref:hypothetical protein n=1 Tax=Streptosporangium sp. OZ121 TaxID=3444183 RepID=UPI003F7948A4